MVARNEPTDPIADAAEQVLALYPPDHAWWREDWLKEVLPIPDAGSVESTRAKVLVHAAITAKARGGVVQDHHIAKAIAILIAGNA